jgi:hypothetical protein
MDSGKNLADLTTLAQLNGLEKLSLCATYFPLNLDVAAITNTLSAANATISGCRELE